MFLLLVVGSLLVLVSFLLIGLVLLQNPKDQGGYHKIGVGGIQQVVGVAHIPGLLERLTQIFVVLFFVLTLFFSFLLQERYEASKFKAPEFESVKVKTTQG